MNFIPELCSILILKQCYFLNNYSKLTTYQILLFTKLILTLIFNKLIIQTSYNILQTSEQVINIVIHNTILNFKPTMND